MEKHSDIFYKVYKRKIKWTIELHDLHIVVEVCGGISAVKNHKYKGANPSTVAQDRLDRDRANSGMPGPQNITKNRLFYC